MKKIKCKCGYIFTYSNGDIIRRYRKKLNKDKNYNISFKEVVQCRNCRKQVIIKRKKWENVTNYLDKSVK